MVYAAHSCYIAGVNVNGEPTHLQVRPIHVEQIYVFVHPHLGQTNRIDAVRIFVIGESESNHKLLSNKCEKNRRLSATRRIQQSNPNSLIRMEVAEDVTNS